MRAQTNGSKLTMPSSKRKVAPKKAVAPARLRANGGPDLRLLRLRELVKILEGSALAELTYEDDDISVTLSKQGSAGSPMLTTSMVAPTMLSQVPVAQPAPSSPPTLVAVAKDEDPSLVVVKSPFVGTFYRAPRPGAPPFAEVGEHVRRGQVICIVEAMKLMNEIESEVDGTVAEILVENAKPVQYGDPLFKIKKG